MFNACDESRIGSIQELISSDLVASRKAVYACIGLSVV